MSFTLVRDSTEMVLKKIQGIGIDVLDLGSGEGFLYLHPTIDFRLFSNDETAVLRNEVCNEVNIAGQSKNLGTRIGKWSLCLR